MDILFKTCDPIDIDPLRNVAIHTFRAAFEAQNDPKHFRAYLRTAFSKTQLLKELSNLNTRFYFVVENEEVVGYVKLNIDDAQNEFGEATGVEIERLYVKSFYQNKGLGGSILMGIEDMARSWGKTYLWLGVWEHNPKAIRFYERTGFKK
ncbi:MAG: GNAT family N-acetyltransferase [Bacteroidota bacterium]